jgi:hypothetical protein
MLGHMEMCRNDVIFNKINYSSFIHTTFRNLLAKHLNAAAS